MKKIQYFHFLEQGTANVCINTRVKFDHLWFCKIAHIAYCSMCLYEQTVLQEACTINFDESFYFRTVI